MANLKHTLLVVLAILMVFGLSGCKTVSGTDCDQIVKAAIDLATAQVSLGQFESALETYTTARQATTDYRLDYNCAIVLSLMGRNLEAAELCEESFANNTNVLKLKKAQADYLYKAGFSEKSYDTYLYILTINPYDRETRFQLIDLYQRDNLPSLAYEQAEIMWNQGYKDTKTIDVLHSIEPELWQNVYNHVHQ